MIQNSFDERTVTLAEYISATGKTVRDAAGHFGLSKSTVHKDITTRLPDLDVDLYEKVRKILDLNKAERHMRGGLATKHKYEEIKEQRSAVAKRHGNFAKTSSNGTPF